MDPFDMLRFCAQAARVAEATRLSAEQTAYMAVLYGIPTLPRREERPVSVADLPDLVRELREQGEDRETIASALIAAAASLAYADGWDEVEFGSACQGGYKALVAQRQSRPPAS